MCLFVCTGCSRCKFLEQPYFRYDCEASEQKSDAGKLRYSATPAFYSNAQRKGLNIY